MALVNKGFELTVSLADNGANISTLRYEGNPTLMTDFATGLALAQGLITELEAITDSIVVGYRFSDVWFEDAIAYPPAGIENENKASISYLIDGTNEVGNIKIPAPVIGIFVAPAGPSANQVNVGDADLNAFLDNFRTTGGFLINDGQFLDVVLKGKRVSAKNNNG